MNKKVVILFVEGETDEEFYNKLIDEIRKCQGGLPCHVKVDNAGGIGNFKEKVVRKFKRNYLTKYSDKDIYIILCYDTDVFEFRKILQLICLKFLSNYKTLVQKKSIQ